MNRLALAFPILVAGGGSALAQVVLSSDFGSDFQTAAPGGPAGSQDAGALLAVATVVVLAALAWRSVARSRKALRNAR